jgi:hypothetical protein
MDVFAGSRFESVAEVIQTVSSEVTIRKAQEHRVVRTNSSPPLVSHFFSFSRYIEQEISDIFMDWDISLSTTNVKQSAFINNLRKMKYIKMTQFLEGVLHFFRHKCKQFQKIGI